MRIDCLKLKNFACFEDREFSSFQSGFNLITGGNGTGKTSLLNALCICMGSWHAGTGSEVVMKTMLQYYDCELTTFPYMDRFIRISAIREYTSGHITSWEKQAPSSVIAETDVFGEKTTQSVNLLSIVQSFSGDRSKIGAILEASMTSGNNIILPLVLYYRADRLAREIQKQINDESTYVRNGKKSRFAGYSGWCDSILSASSLIQWIDRQEYIAYQNREKRSDVYKTVFLAMIRCLEGAKEISGETWDEILNVIQFDPKHEDLVIQFANQVEQPFLNLSDGQRTMLTLVGDIARRAATLNPHLGGRVLLDTPGVVLIDELDLHLHPRWQRRVIADLKRTFPSLQFFCTTHSPQLIGQARPEEIIRLDHDSPHPGQSYGMDSNWVLRHVMGGQDRDADVADRMDALFAAIDEDRFDEAQEMVNTLRRELGEHPELVEAQALISRYTRFADLERE